MSASAARHVYGPVPSRRLGRSLGVDLVPFKVCSFDCVYCQLGRTTTKTTERKEWVPLDDVLGELRERLSPGPPCDFVGLAGGPDGILVLLRRRPCTIDGIADGLGVHRTEVLKRLGGLLGEGRVRRIVSNDQAFYMASEPDTAESGRRG